MSFNKFERTGRRPSMLSDWQRCIGEGSADGHDPRCRMIDVDGIYWCLRCAPPVPLAIFEEFQDQSKSLQDKTCTCTKELGRLLGIRAFCAKNHPDRQDPYTELKDLKTGRIQKFYFRQFANWIMRYFYDAHDKEHHGGEFSWNAGQQKSDHR